MDPKNIKKGEPIVPMGPLHIELEKLLKLKKRKEVLTKKHQRENSEMGQEINKLKDKIAMIHKSNLIKI